MPRMSQPKDIARIHHPKPDISVKQLASLNQTHIAIQSGAETSGAQRLPLAAGTFAAYSVPSGFRHTGYANPYRRQPTAGRLPRPVSHTAPKKAL
ncbi:hypothetical protein KCP77_16590 [Salmonella enterica subsp. enterica]|nr:hypothetical protein KCP77_16590 [Salmonella enterica subsp. enterica]